MPELDYFGSGPQHSGGIVTWTSTYFSSVFGYYDGYGFAGNGYWNAGAGTMAGTNDATSTMTFTFDTLQAGVGGVLNWAPGYGAASIAVYDSLNKLIESSPITFLTGNGYDLGEFHGFLEGSPIIKAFTLTGACIGITDLTITDTGYGPEPATMLMLGMGLVGVARIARRRR